LTLFSILVTSGIKLGEADPDYYFTLYAVLDATEPFHGWNAGYHSIMQAIKTELAKIGINLELTYWDSGTIYDTCWESYWDRGCEDGGNLPPAGWDLTTGEQWLYTTGLTWMGAYVYKEAIGAAGNVGPWLNLKADRIYRMAEAELDPVKRKELLLKWQEIYMHDVPMINMFYTTQYEVQPKWFHGYDYTACYGDWRWNTWLNNTLSPRPTVLTFGIDETMYAGVNPLFMDTYGTEAYAAMAFDCLYANTRYPYPPSYNTTLWNTTMLEAYPYVMAPQVASGKPVYYDDGRTVLIPIRDDVPWVWPESDAHPLVEGKPQLTGYKLDAYDVKFTFDVTIDPDTGASGYGDYASVVESVEVVSNETLMNDYPELYGGYNYTEQGRADEVFPWMDSDTVNFREPYVAKINLYKPHADFELLFGVVWGATILPHFVLEDIPHVMLRSHPTQFDVELLPQTGPFLLKKGGYIPDVEATLGKNPYWWGNDKPYGPDDPNNYLATIDTFVIKFIVDPAARKIELFAGNLEICEAPVAHVDEFEALDPDTFNIYTEPRAITANMIRLNLNNPILANRYVRMAIAHAIPYSAPADPNIPGILRGWGLYCDYPGYAVPLTEAISPYTVLGGEDVYHTELEPYGYDLDKARYYLDLYLNQTSITPELGPVGDADQSGIVDFDDWWIWRDNIGTAIDTPIDIYPTWPYAIDPDFNNDGNILDDDEILWWTEYGTEYR